MARRHDPHPKRVLTSSGTLEVLQGMDVVDLNGVMRAAEFACIRQEALNECRPGIPGLVWIGVQHSIPAPPERYASPVGPQWPLPVSLDADHHPRTRLGVNQEGGREACIDLRHGHLQLGSQCLGQ